MAVNDQTNRGVPYPSATVSIPIRELRPFRHMPFKARGDDEMDELVRSIQKYGVMTPLIIRRDPEGGYEIIAGHRRCRAAELAGLDTVPAVVMDLDDDAAVIVSVDSNITKQAVLPSELAMAYRAKKRANRRVQPDSTIPAPPETRFKTPGANEDRYIRLLNLNTSLLKLVDSGRIGIDCGYELSYLTGKEQQALLRTIRYTGAVPTPGQALKMRMLSRGGQLTELRMRLIMAERG